MRLLKIDYPTPISKVEDIENDNIDIFVTLDDGITYSLVVTTPQNYYWYMDKEGMDFIPASPPDIIVRRLTEENIQKAVESYIADNGYWIKLFFLAGQRSDAFEIDELNKMIEKIKKSNAEIANS
ncbi:hypothetical protein ABEX25_24420 [Paenibacillus thiaminolyticus]|uniref:hypothetical protein n=1 Tax=Paenibacillus thiaminolyticus TaxID=49283 RepID=UPI003D28DD56